MITTFETIVENGLLRPLTPSLLTDGQKVVVLVELAEQPSLTPSQRLPDSPIEEWEMTFPCELPRPKARLVHVERMLDRLPEGLEN